MERISSTSVPLTMQARGSLPPRAGALSYSVTSCPRSAATRAASMPEGPPPTTMAFPGCSAETEASFETIVDLADDLITDKLSHIVILKNSKKNLAQTIIRASEKQDVRICELDSLQSVTSEDIDGGFTYLNAMKQNKEVISECLN